MTRLPVGLLALVLAASPLIVAMPAAGAAAAVLVSTIGQADGETNSSNLYDSAQAFTTGSAAKTLGSVDIEFASVSDLSATYSVSVWDGLPGTSGATKLGTLLNPTLTVSAADAVYNFRATGMGISLSASTTYWVVMDVDVGTPPVVRHTSSDAEDSGGASGWSVGNSSHYRNRGNTDTSTASWLSWYAARKMRVNEAEPDTTAPMFSTAQVSGNRLTVVFDEPMDPAAKPANSTFDVQVAGSRRNVTSYTLSGRYASLTLQSAVTSAQTVTVAYTKPGSGTVLQDVAGNALATFTAQTVTNATNVRLSVSQITETSASLTISNYIADWWYEGSLGGRDGCTKVNAGTRQVTLTGLFPGFAYTYKAYSDNTCTTELTTADRDVHFRTPRPAPRHLSTLAAPGFTVTEYSGYGTDLNSPHRDSVQLRWTGVANPLSPGESVQNYQYRYQHGSGRWGRWTAAWNYTHSCAPTHGCHNLLDLPAGTINFQMRSVVEQNPYVYIGPASSSVSVTVPFTGALGLSDGTNGRPDAVDPASIRITHSGASLSVSWDAPAGATHYDVTYQGNGIDARAAWNRAGTALTITCDIRSDHHGRHCVGAQWAYGVGIRARNAAGESGWVYSASRVRMPAPDAVDPASISVAHSGTSLSVSWDAPAGATHYDVTYQGNGIDARAAWNRAGTALTITCDVRAGYEGQNCVSPEGAYGVGLRARNAAGESGWVYSGSLARLAAPDAVDPASISVTHNGASLSVSWDAPARAAKYDVEYQAGGATSWTSAATDHAGTSLTISSGVDAAANYIVRVKARNAGGESSYANSATAIAPTSAPDANTPDAVTAVIVLRFGSQMFVTWDAAARATSYDVDYSADDSTSWVSAGQGYAYTVMLIRGLDATKTYVVRVKARNASGESAWTNSA